MRNWKRLIAITAVPVLVGGWALFRPELLFINQTVNEKLPVTAGQTERTIASGMFVSEAHETKGKAEIVNTGGKNYLRLTNFHTSNGPDVKIYLVKGTDATQGNVLKAGFVDLGTLKGNVGDQFYEIPADVNLDDYQSVTVWCKRFAVGFGSATLTEPISLRDLKPIATPKVNLISFGAETIEVTSGRFEGGTIAGNASIVEQNGQRFVRFKWNKAQSAKYELRLMKQETIKMGTFPAKAEFVKLGQLSPKLTSVPISTKLDLWLYRSIAVVDPANQKIVGFAHLRSAQERNRGTLL